MKNDFKRFDIVLVDFGKEIVGSEQGGKRPAIIIQNDRGNLFSTTTIVIPITSRIKNPYQSTHTLLRKGESKGLRCDSMVLGECVKQISEERIIKYIGSISDVKEKKEIKRVYDANFGEWGE